MRYDNSTKNTGAPVNPARRRFLSGALATGALIAAAPVKALAHAVPQKDLSFRNLHTGETLDVPFWRNGQYIDDSLKQINHLLRDHRADEVANIDPELLDLLFDLKREMGTNGSIHVISGYRAPATNKMLRRTGGGGVAKKSYHMRGMAIDLRIPGVELSQLRQAAISLKRGGVGYYPRSNFIHVDTGRVRRW